MPRSLAGLLLAGLGGAGPPRRAGDRDPVGTWPLDPRPEVVATFDPPDDPWGAGHRGVDLAGRVGQAVRAALPGEVVFAGRVAGKPVVTVSHGDTRTTYEPVVASVAVGARVAAGGGGRRARPAGQPLLPAGLPALGLAARATPTSTRSTSSVAARCACCRCGATEPVAAAGWRPPLAPVRRVVAARLSTRSTAWRRPLPAGRSSPGLLRVAGCLP